MATRNPKDFHPIMVPYFGEVMKAWEDEGLRVALLDVFRDPREQDTLFARGRDPITFEIVNRSLVVTYVRGGRSFHNVMRNGLPASLGFDIAFRRVSDGRIFYPPDRDPRWKRAGVIAESLGLTWGVTHGKIDFDLGHYQLDDRGTLKIWEIVDLGIDPKGRGAK